jgi:hypothetical protein
MELIMASLRRRLELVLFGLYFVAIAVGTAMETIGQLAGR